MKQLTALEQHLVDTHLMTEENIRLTQSDSLNHGVDLIEAIVQLGYADSRELYASLAQFCELPYSKVTAADIPEDAVELVPARIATHFNIVPVGMNDDAVIIAISDPLHSSLIDEIQMVLQQTIEPIVATPGDIGKAIKELYGLGADTVERILGDDDKSGETVHIDSAQGVSDLGDDSIDASIIKFVNELFLEAIQTNATDIHIEPFEDELRVRYRIDGVLHPIPVPSTIRGFHQAIVSRVKVMANLNIAEKRLPQDGKIQVSLGDGKYDLRISLLPTPYGETLNIRILARSSMFLTLRDLGFLDEDLDQFNTFIQRPHGIILVTGPTGSGKTTTLYASLNKLNQTDRKTITIEDPIEYQMKGITQMQVMPQIGFDFSTGLRSMLRHDPDVMMVGEIRDYETAEMSIRASLTGHLVFSTLHTNDAAGTVTRLVDMGVEPFLIASTMIASIAQRLVRKVCDTCGESFEPGEEAIQEFRVSASQLVGANFRRGTGCEACRNTGYRGRVAICEIMPFLQPIKELTVNGATSSVIKQKACELGMRTLRDSGWQRVFGGDTTLEEVLRVTADTDFMGE